MENVSSHCLNLHKKVQNLHNLGLELNFLFEMTNTEDTSLVRDLDKLFCSSVQMRYRVWLTYKLHTLEQHHKCRSPLENVPLHLMENSEPDLSRKLTGSCIRISLHLNWSEFFMQVLVIK